MGTDALNMKIRNAVIEDIDEIMRLEQEAFIEEIQEERKVFLERIKVFPEGFFILEDETGNISGYFSSELWNSYPESEESFKLGHSASSSHKKTGTVLYISSIALGNSLRGKGMGTVFLEKCVEKIKETNNQLKGTVLIVNEKWEKARHIYKKFGYSEYKTLEMFFPDGNGILMKKMFE